MSRQEWLANNGYGYITLAPGADPQTVIAKMARIQDRTMTGEFEKLGINRTGSEADKLHLTPFSRGSSYVRSMANQCILTPPGSWITVYGVGAIRSHHSSSCMFSASRIWRPPAQ